MLNEKRHSFIQTMLECFYFEIYTRGVLYFYFNMINIIKGT